MSIRIGHAPRGSRIITTEFAQRQGGFVMLKFTHNAWPFVESSTPPGFQTN